MLKECADALVELVGVGGVFAYTDGIKPVLALDIVVLLLAVGEGRVDPLYLEVVVGVVVEGEGTEERAVAVVLQTVEIDVELERLVEGAESGSAGVGDKSVDVVGPYGEETEVEAVVDAVAQDGL